MKVSLSKNGKKVDEVKSYTAFRKISAERDANGIMRMRLNNKNLFQYGPLDQGWWPDGLYTAPTDEALLYDIVKTKAWGFNMIRKHVKVEPARWYYHCDKEGMLVWQDMPSGDMGNQWAPHTYNGGTDKERTEESIRNYYKEWKEIMDLCVSNPSVVVWVPFNEAWGQFDTERIVNWTMEYDPSRLVNPASGGNHRPCGHMLDLHNYPGPAMKLFDPQRVNVLGEYGGIGLPTMEKPGNPFETTTSTATGIARTPTMVAEYNEHRSCIMSRTRAEGVHDMFHEAPRVRHRLNGDHVETHTSIDPIVGRQEAIGNTFVASALRRRNRFLRKAFIAARARFHLDKHQAPVIESDDIGLACSARPVAL